MNRTTGPLERIAPGAVLTATGGTFRILSWRGEGSFARVYRAVAERTGRPCAVKLAKPEIPEAAARLREEGDVLAGINHVRVVSLLGSGELGPVPFLALEWLEAETLLDRVAGVSRAPRRLPLRESLEYLEAICEGLAQFHARGRCHGDLRPQNVLLVEGRGAVLTDPGTAEQPYAPTDVQAAAALFHLMLTGHHPAPGAGRLSRAEGYSPRAVGLWDRASADPSLPVLELLEDVRRLRQSL